MAKAGFKFPPGNKYGLGNEGGRPPIHDKAKIAEELIEWSKKHDSINLNKFCALHEPPISPAMFCVWVREFPEFRQASEIAKANIAYRREEWLNSEQLHVKAFEKNDTVYDIFMREEKRNQMEFEASLKVEAAQALGDEDTQRYNAIMDQLSQLQSKRKNSSKTSSSDKKS